MTATSGRWQPGPTRGFQRWTEPGRVVVVADRWVEAVSIMCLAENGSLKRGLSTLDGAHGRGPTSIVPLPGSSSKLHLRPVRHGGWFGDALGGTLLGLRRPLDELRVTASLAERGAPVPSPALVLAERAGMFWNATVGTVFEPDTVDGIAFLVDTYGRG